MINGFILSGIADEGGDTLEQQIAIHKKIGFDYIEMRNVNRVTVDTTPMDIFKGYCKTLDESGIKISALASDIGKLSLAGSQFKPFDEDVRSLEGLLEKALYAGVSYIRVMGYKGEGLGREAWYKESVERLKVLSGMAQKAGVYLALENCVGPHAGSGADMAKYLDDVGSEHLVCLYDTGNPVSGHEADTWEFYTALRGRIKYLHIKDASGSGETFTYPGEGGAMIVRILEDLYKSGYNGFCSIEPHMSASAHRPDTKYIVDTPENTYYKYGCMLKEIVQSLNS